MREVLRWFRGGNVGVAIKHGRWGCLSYDMRVMLVLVTRLCCGLKNFSVRLVRII